MEGKTNGLQIAGFVVSLVSCFIFGFYGLAGITGLVLSAVGRSQAKQNGGKTGLGTSSRKHPHPGNASDTSFWPRSGGFACC